MQTYRAEREFMSAQLGEGGWSSDRCVAGRVRVKQLFTGCAQSMLSDLKDIAPPSCTGNDCEYNNVTMSINEHNEFGRNL